MRSSTSSATPEHIEHPLAPVFDSQSEVLVLGSFPSPQSRATGFYYGNPQNRMWKVLAAVCGEPEPTTIERKRDFLLRNHIAMWDVLASCTITGASDASITHAQPNDMSKLFERSAIRAVFCAGATAAKLYHAHCEAQTGIPAQTLPSTSPANAAYSLDDLVKAWSVLGSYLHGEVRPALDVEAVVQLEHDIAAAGTPLSELMDWAGTWLAWHVHAHDPQAPVAILAGNGNNGGDGWVAAKLLARQGHEVCLITARNAAELTAQPARDAACAASEEFAHTGVRVCVAPSREEVEQELARANIIVDALLGTGFAFDEVKEPFASWIEQANACKKDGAWIVSADCPSGLNAQTGAAARQCIHADETVTMIVSKTGLHTPEGSRYCGTIHIAPLCEIGAFLR